MNISVVLPVLAPTSFLQAMTEFSIKALRAHADHDFELIVVEAEYNHFNPEHWKAERIDKYLNFTPKIGGVKEINAGIRIASGNFIVFTGNDVIVPLHWDTALMHAFDARKDCGISSLSAAEPGAYIGPVNQWENRGATLVEGMYSPFSMFRKGWFYDESYKRVYQDSDLVMRMYESGLRAYRNPQVMVHHLLRMTNDNYQTQEHNRLLAEDEALFYQRWGDSPLMMYGLIRYGAWQFGQEHISLRAPINRHR